MDDHNNTIGINMGWFDTITEHLGVDADTIQKAYENSAFARDLQKAKEYSKGLAQDFVDKSMALERPT